MRQSLAQISFLVKDYDEAIDFFINKLCFDLLEDVLMSPSKRWVVLAPKGNSACKLLLAKAANEQQLSAVGNQTGGRVFLFLHTDNIERDFVEMQKKGIEFTRSIISESWGKAAVFKDLYGNLWDLVETSVS